MKEKSQDKQKNAQVRTGNNTAADKDQSGCLDCIDKVTLKRRWHIATNTEKLGNNLDARTESMPHTIYSSRITHIMLNCSQPDRAFGVLILKPLFENPLFDVQIQVPL
jgi:hypothetical protein